MPTNTAKPQPQAPPQADHASIAAQAQTLEAQAATRRAELLEALKVAEHDQRRAQQALAALSQEREDIQRQRAALEARASAEAAAQAAQRQAQQTVDRYRQAMSAVAEQLAPLAGLIAEALEAELALVRIEQQRERDTGVAPLVRHTRQRIVDALRVAGFAGGLQRRGEFDGHPANMSFGTAPLAAAFAALPAGLADPPQAPPPQPLSAHAPKPVAVAMPPLSPDPAFSGSPFDQPSAPAPSAALPPLVPFDPTRR